MNAGLRTCLGALLLATSTLGAAESFEEAMVRASLDYAERLRTANEELARTRTRIADEKAPLLKSMRAAEDRIIAADQEATRLQTAVEQAVETRRRLNLDADTLRKNAGYMTALAHDGLKAYGDGLAPGEDQLLSEPMAAFERALDEPEALRGGGVAANVADFLLARVEQSLGGYAAPGSATVGDDNRVVAGTFAFVGPETYFQADQGGTAGTVRIREGAPRPVAYVLTAWDRKSAAALFQGQPGTIMADASAGKALRLRETRGTIWQHVRKGGVVAYAILGVGLLAALMIAQKVRDLSRMAVDKPATVERVLAVLAEGAIDRARDAAGSLSATTRELVAAGLRHLDDPKDILEEHLYAVVLRQRLHYERWLPLLAVIATAAPLMGLLGTVTGLVRTFALITVFGTGDAGKLAGGISEVLVATELGLMVAIPTLVAHGFLSHRIQKSLSLLERYALEFSTAAQTARAHEAAREAVAK